MDVKRIPEPAGRMAAYRSRKDAFRDDENAFLTVFRFCAERKEYFIPWIRGCIMIKIY
jgi:hypothetical protein